jgi:hypothetical protein
MDRKKSATRSAKLQGLFDRTEMDDDTRRVYSAQWSRFAAWCAARGSLALPARPRLVVLYLAHLAAVVRERPAPSTMRTVCSAVAKAHELFGYAPPTEDPIVVARRRRVIEGSAYEPRRTARLTAMQIRRMVVSTDDDLVDLRDRALLLVGYAAMLWPKHLVGLNVADLLIVGEQLQLVLPVRRILIPPGLHPITCALRAVRAWIHAAALPADGPLFIEITRWGRPCGRLSDHEVSSIVQDRARAAGLPLEGVSADSLHLGSPDERRLL